MVVKRIFGYIKAIMDFGLLYCKDNSALVGYSDADWSSDYNDFNSTTGYIFKIGDTAVSKEQSCVALSTTEAEYMALASAAQEDVWMRELVCD